MSRSDKETVIIGITAVVATTLIVGMGYYLMTFQEKRKEQAIQSQRVSIACDQARRKILSIVRYEPPMTQYGMNKIIETQKRIGELNDHEAKVAQEIAKNADLWVSVPVGVRYVNDHPFEDFSEREATAWRIGSIACNRSS